MASSGNSAQNSAEVCQGLLRNLNLTIQELLTLSPDELTKTLRDDSPLSPPPDSPVRVTSPIPLPVASLSVLPLALRLCFCLERILSHHLKSGIFSKATVWDFVENLPKCLPATGEVIDQIRKRCRTPQGRGRAFIRDALKEGRLSEYIGALVMTDEITKDFYRPTALLRKEDQMFIFSQLLQFLDSKKLEITVACDLDAEDYWSHFYETGESKEGGLEGPGGRLTPSKSLPQSQLEIRKPGSSSSASSVGSLNKRGISPRLQQHSASPKRPKEGAPLGASPSAPSLRPARSETSVSPRMNESPLVKKGGRAGKKKKAKVASIDLPEEQRHIKETFELEAEIEEIRFQTLELRISLQKEIKKNELHQEQIRLKDSEIKSWKAKCADMKEEVDGYQEYIAKNPLSSNAPPEMNGSSGVDIDSEAVLEEVLAVVAQAEGNASDLEEGGISISDEEDGNEGTQLQNLAPAMEDAQVTISELIESGQTLIDALSNFSFPNLEGMDDIPESLIYESQGKLLGSEGETEKESEVEAKESEVEA
eukprot:CAMPEP_0201480396 /NCGR_PEP_ID=MMETSP0151_2-20130828/4881_1 /ASSEMBLY_ACC=CAM_ASM_000257 /TAXON_ID=200890 /ORGANISM="Paramoeba atlantica, Strain 621/1 / CCAP 1560/9" /LENGTH=536 /DNA_ID=CAMNT_0047862231 /DNA_START=41 /DNA_END=1648 /DNA_ORIENTATION=+